MRSSVIIISAFFALPLCLGQMCGGTPTPEPEPQLVVTDQIRTACQNWMVGDDALLAQMGNYRSVHDEGVTRTEVFDSLNNIALNYLSTPAERTAYVTCMGSMINEVWK